MYSTEDIVFGILAITYYLLLISYMILLIIQGFKNKEYQILITSVQKGLNFGDCNYCIFYGFDPNPSSMIQFEGRTTRSFDIIGKNVYILCSMGKEYKQLHAKLRSRTVATTEMSKTDLSVVLSILLGDMSDVSSED
jgi:ERCC4-related helicase